MLCGCGGKNLRCMNIKGKIMIRKGNENGEPCIVYVSHLNTNFDCWVTPQLNSGIVHLSKEEQLIEFNWKLFNRMYYEWKIEQLPKQKERFKELLSEWD